MVGVVLVYFAIKLSFSDRLVVTAASAFTSKPSKPFYVEDGKNTTLVWGYTFDGTVGSAAFTNFTVGDASDVIGKIFGTTGNLHIEAKYIGRFEAQVSNTQAQLKILRVQRSDQGIYRFILNPTGAGVLEDEVQVIVQFPATLTNVSSNQTVLEGSGLQLVCEFSGSPVPNVTWARLFQNDSLSEPLNTGPTWNITNINRINAGTYHCTAYNGVGNPVSHTLELNVLYPAKIIKHQNSSVQVGGFTALVCQSEGNPSPVITWKRDNTENIVGVGSTLCVCSAQFHDSGRYTCSVMNSVGNDHASVFLEVTEQGANLINVTMKITNVEYHEDFENLGSERSQSLIARLEKAMKAVFQGDSSFESTRVVRLRPGSVIVSFVLIFNRDVTTEQAISVLRRAADSGKLGDFKVDGSAIVATEEYDFKTGNLTTNEPTSVEVCRECSCNCTILIAVVCTLVATIIALVIYIIWLHRKEARRKERQYQNPVDEKGKYNTALEMSNREPSLVVPRQQASESSSRSQYMALDEERRSAELLEHPNTNNSQISEYAPLHPSTRSWEIPRENVTIEKVIGKGTFGQVAKGTAVGLQGKSPKTQVAVKMLKAGAPESDRKDLFSELEVMKTLKPHQHVIKLLGCVTESEPLLVLIEYVPYGDLLGYLRRSRGLNDTYYKDPDVKPQTSLTSQQLMKFAWQIADGMNYLSSRSIIHRDLAARNVLVGEGERCKVTDFGMARDVQQENIYERKTTGRLPVKWTAYEALLYGTYTTKSDVWSYGVLLYEIFTIGGSPYPRMDGRKIASLLQQEYRMPKPKHVNDELYKIMTMCWQEDPNARPTFGDLRNKLKQMENQHKRLIDMNMYDTQLYANVEDLGV